jgi:hypothetical protein
MPSTWGDTASNGLVTWDALRDAVSNSIFESKVPLSSIPSGLEIVTKQNVQDYIYVNTAASPWSGYTSLRCPPKSSFVVNNICTMVSISYSDILSATNNTSYPNDTVYVRTADGTTSYTVAGEYPLCTRPTPDYPPAEYIYYYANDTIQYFTVSTINFYPSSVSCSTSGCTPSYYATLYDAFTCAGCSGGGTPVNLYSNSAPAWVVGTRVFDINGQNVADGRYTYGGKCYHVQNITQQAYIGISKFVDRVQSIVVSVTDC